MLGVLRRGDRANKIGVDDFPSRPEREAGTRREGPGAVGPSRAVRGEEDARGRAA